MRILIAEDELVSRRLLESTLKKWGHEVVVTCDGEEAWKRLQEPDAPDLAILDWVMPGKEGPEICRKIRATDRSTYVILLTGKGDKEDIVSGLESGADDYVSKPFNPQELRARVKTGARIVGLQKALADRVAELEVLSKRFETLSLEDQLTGVPNRRHLDETLDREWRRAMRSNGFLAAIMVDIDSFKKFNDHYGHPAGDECLKSVARTLQGCIMRAGDFLGRYGGEEFTAIIPETDVPGVLHVSELMRSRVQALGIPHGDCRSNLGVVTISLGVAVTTPRKGITPQEFVSRADRALYLAKQANGNCVKTAGAL